MRFFSIVISFFLAIVLLIETIGITEFNSRCPYTGKTKTQYVFYSCCCGGESKGCCELSLDWLSYKADCFSQSADCSYEVSDLNADYVLANLAFDINENDYFVHRKIDFICDPPPKWRSGKSILIEYETFLI